MSECFVQQLADEVKKRRGALARAERERLLREDAALEAKRFARICAPHSQRVGQAAGLDDLRLLPNVAQGKPLAPRDDWCARRTALPFDSRRIAARGEAQLQRLCEKRNACDLLAEAFVQFQASRRRALLPRAAGREQRKVCEQPLFLRYFRTLCFESRDQSNRNRSPPAHPARR